MDFAIILKKLRVQNNESQKKLAEKLGVSYQTISKWENGITMPDISLYKSIAQHYNVTIDFLLNDCMKFHFLVSINKESQFSIWTDFNYNDTIAPVSLNDCNRHSLSVLKNGNVIIAVDENKKIVLAYYKENRNYGYYRDSNNKGTKYCFIELEGHKSNEEKHEWQNCEFVIPKNGFLIIADSKDYYANLFMKTIIPCKYHKYLETTPLYSNYSNRYDGKRLFGNVLLNGELDSMDLYLLDNKLFVEKYNPDDRMLLLNDLNENVGLMSKQKINEKVEEIEVKLCELENKIDYLE